jgi:hypothetical protein
MTLWTVVNKIREVFKAGIFAIISTKDSDSVLGVREVRNCEKICNQKHILRHSSCTRQCYRAGYLDRIRILPTELKGQCHEIFDPLFFSSNTTYG